MIVKGDGKAAKQASSVERTTKEGGKRGDPSEFARKKNIRTRKEAGNAKYAASICSLQEWERTKRLMFEGAQYSSRRIDDSRVM